MARNSRETQSKDLLFVSVVILNGTRTACAVEKPGPHDVILSDARSAKSKGPTFRPHPLRRRPERKSKGTYFSAHTPYVVILSEVEGYLLFRPHPLRRHPERSTRSVCSRSACPERSRRNLLFRPHPLRCHPERSTHSVRSRRTCFSLTGSAQKN